MSIKPQKNFIVKINPASLRNENSRYAFLLYPHIYSREEIANLLGVKAEQGLSEEEPETGKLSINQSESAKIFNLYCERDI